LGQSKNLKIKDNYILSKTKLKIIQFQFYLNRLFLFIDTRFFFTNFFSIVRITYVIF